MGCIQSSSHPVKQIRVVQAGEGGHRGSRGSVHPLPPLPPRTPLPNQVEDQDESLSRLPTGELQTSPDWRRGSDLGGTGGEISEGSSPDSGVFELLGAEYAGVVTERSRPEVVQTVEESFQPPDPDIDLVVTGQACARRTSNLTRMRSEEAAILELLEQEGLLAKERATTVNGVSYELVAPEGAEDEALEMEAKPGPWSRLPPLKLEKLEKRRSKHSKHVTSSEQEISEKLERAEERRKEAELERARRLAERAASARPETRLMETVARHQREMERFESTLENREQHLQEVREKLRQHHEHAAVIRLKKALKDEEEGVGSGGGSEGEEGETEVA